MGFTAFIITAIQSKYFFDVHMLLLVCYCWYVIVGMLLLVCYCWFVIGSCRAVPGE